MTTLGHYRNWLNSVGGHCSSGIQSDPDIGMVPVTKLISPDGRRVIFPGDQSEVLSPMSIEYLDRRLGVLSPFKSEPRS